MNNDEHELIDVHLKNAYANAKDGLATLNRIMDANYVVGLAYVAGCLKNTLRAIGRLEKKLNQTNNQEEEHGTTK